VRSALLIVLVAIALECASCSSMHRAPASRPLGTGMQVFPVATRSSAPKISGATITGGSLDLADEVGHGVVAVNVWASWCAPCREEMPVLARAVGTRLRVVGIDERDSSGSARSFATSRGVTYPSLSDPEGELLADLPMLPQAGVPSTLFLDAHGRVAARVIGPVDARVLRRIIRQLGAS
jgi:thiol-disulfide isomerase/thioredoxin